MPEVISQLPPVTEPMVDKSGAMTRSWRRFFESQWLRSGGFQDYIYSALLASGFGDATIADLYANQDAIAGEIARLQSSGNDALSAEALARMEALQNDIARALSQADERASASELDSLLNARIEALRAALQSAFSEDVQQAILDLRRDFINLSNQIVQLRGEDNSAVISALTTTNVAEGANLYFTTTRARASISATGSISYNSTTGIISYTAGTSAAYDVGTSGAKIPLLNGINTWSAAQTFTVAPVFTDGPGSRTALGLTIGTDVQAYDADLASIASFAGTGTGGLIYRSASDTWSAVTIGTNLGFAAGTLGSALGTAATQNTGTSGANVVLANAANTWAATQTFTVAPTFTDASGSRSALGLGTGATINTGTSGASLVLANGANTWSATQTFTLAPVFTDVSGTRTALGLVIGTDVQAYDADLASIAGFAGTGTGGLIYRSASNTWSAVTVAAGLGFAAGTLGSALGTAATQNTGTSGANLPFLNGSNVWTGQQAIGDGTGTAPFIIIDGAAATAKRLNFKDAGVLRWELGPNTLNNFVLRRSDAAGAVVDTPIAVNGTTGTVALAKPLQLPPSTVAALPSAATYNYTLAVALDLLAPTLNAIAVGGGTVTGLVLSDGVNWRVA